MICLFKRDTSTFFFNLNNLPPYWHAVGVLTTGNLRVIGASRVAILIIVYIVLEAVEDKVLASDGIALGLHTLEVLAASRVSIPERLVDE